MLELKGTQISDAAVYALGTMEADLHNLDEAVKYKNILWVYF